MNLYSWNENACYWLNNDNGYTTEKMMTLFIFLHYISI